MSFEIARKTKVAVLYGGSSVEHDVSLRSAGSVLAHLDREKFEVIPILIDREGRWYIQRTQEKTVLESLFSEKEPIVPFFEMEALRSRLMLLCDLVFPVLHGSLGEDGIIQGFLEVLGIPYVGAGVLGSAIGMNKGIAKRLVQADGIPIVPYINFHAGQWERHHLDYSQRISTRLGYPVFVKPLDGGSSAGITKVMDANALTVAVQLAFIYSKQVLVEKALNVRELEVAVLENSIWGEPPLVSCIGEIIPHHVFYSYEAKYVDEKGASLVVPTEFAEASIVSRFQELARQIFMCLACEGMARVDFFLEKHTHKIYFNEINTIPGFTDISMYPKLWEASGLLYGDLLTELIQRAIDRHKRQS